MISTTKKREIHSSEVVKNHHVNSLRVELRTGLGGIARLGAILPMCLVFSNFGGETIRTRRIHVTMYCISRYLNWISLYGIYYIPSMDPMGNDF